MMMIEKMARAICVLRTSRDPDDLATSNRKVWTFYEPDARAALTALLEPSEGMLGARGCVDYREYERHYRAMIQAALDEKEGV